jgi:hypothetical protein
MYYAKCYTASTRNNSLKIIYICNYRMKDSEPIDERTDKSDLWRQPLSLCLSNSEYVENGGSSAVCHWSRPTFAQFGEQV